MDSDLAETMALDLAAIMDLAQSALAQDGVASQTASKNTLSPERVFFSPTSTYVVRKISIGRKMHLHPRRY